MTTSFLHLNEISAAAALPGLTHPCATPGCPHLVTEPWEESGLLCYECAIEGELYDRDARWDHVCPIPGTHLLPGSVAEERDRKAKNLRH